MPTSVCLRACAGVCLAGLVAIDVPSTGLAAVPAADDRAAQAQAAPAVLAPWPDAKTMEDRRRAATNRRLFRVTEPLSVTLTANWRAVNGDRNPESTRTWPATIEFAKDDGALVSMPVQVGTRGHARLKICSAPPLRLEFPKDQTKGTVFDGHGALKLGTHCHNDYEEYVLREYAVYVLYNLLTPRSYRARLAKVTYVDAASKRVNGTKYGLFIEDADDVAKRLDGQIVDLQKVTFARVDMETLTLMMLFEYMIGNTDMSMFLLHNIRLVQTQAGMRYTVPYDFDYSGLVRAMYAVPAAHFKLSSVRERLYIGPCRTAAELEPFFDKMRALKTNALALYDTLPDMKPYYRKEAKAYLEEFYKTIDNPRDVKRAFIDGCNNRPYM
jgi:hypothetical protein